jgi:hypothetical protein
MLPLFRRVTGHGRPCHRAEPAPAAASSLSDVTQAEVVFGFGEFQWYNGARFVSPGLSWLTRSFREPAAIHVGVLPFSTSCRYAGIGGE